MRIKKTLASPETPPAIDISEANQVRALCILLVLQAVVSFRSIPRILQLFKEKSYNPFGWVPHFTSVINWTLRLGLGMLKKVAPIYKPWLAIIDHSIDIGTKKVLVVLRVRLDTLSKRNRAVCLEDCECIGLKIAEKVNGESIALDLEEIFKNAGMPEAIVKDCDRTLHKGVRLYSDKQDTVPLVIDDIGHVIAAALKAQFEKTDDFKSFTALVSKGAKSLRQTELAFLVPPKLRSKGRFQRIGKLGEWADKILGILDDITEYDKQEKDLHEKLNKALPDFAQSSGFIKDFATTVQVTAQIMKILKNKGLDEAGHEQSQKILKPLSSNSKVKRRLKDWLQQHLDIKKHIATVPLLVSSDIIESLFGNFKHIIERSPQADMNRTTLLIPALCGNFDEGEIAQALHQANHEDLKAWEQENIPYTLRKKRQAFFSEIKIQKAGNKCAA